MEPPKDEEATTAQPTEPGSKEETPTNSTSSNTEGGSDGPATAEGQVDSNIISDAQVEEMDVD